ncbi:hypothetical protein [Kutzneria chonburiensis]|uniref:Transposase n=1 Tax=Kutzneria chonburiensis TaxID=1483604 RepID=A0ABV6MS64_9PSEU|nr:hypothetical protein [Kutzneria chonburiensis]
MDLDEAMDRLYGRPRAEFIAARDKLAKSQPGLADRIRKLRKPTVAAWQANHLSRTRRKDIAALVDIGRQLRAAQESLNGPELRELSGRRAGALDKLVARLPDAAPDLRELLERSIADPAAADDLLAGRLVTMPETTGWGFGDAPLVASTAPVDRKRAEERRRAQQAFDDATAASEEAQQQLDAAEAELQSRTDHVQRLQNDLVEARRARDAAATAAKERRQEVQRRAKDVRTAEARLAGL